MSDAVFITDDAGAFVYICPNVDVIFGYSNQEVEELGNITALLGDGFVDHEQLRSSGEMKNIEREITDKSGNGHSLLVNVKGVSIKGGTVLYTCRDITERKRAEEELLALKEFNENVVQSIHEGLFAVDRDFRITLWNRAMEKVSGLPVEEALGKDAFDLLPCLTEQGVGEQLQAALEGEASARSHIPFHTSKRKAGFTNERYLPLWNPEEEVVGALTIVEDVTEAHRREQEVARLQEEIEQRKLVEIAKGILMREISLSEDESFRFIQKKSQDESKKMREVARQVIDFFGSEEERKKLS